MSFDDVAIAFGTALQLPILNSNGSLGRDANTNISNSNPTKAAKYFSIKGNKVQTSTSISAVTTSAGMKGQSFTSGYIFIPFDLINETGIKTIKEIGSVPIVSQGHRYYAKNQLNASGNWDWRLLKWEETDFGGSSTGEIKYWFDRSASYSECYFITDYNKFIESCINENDLSTVYTSSLASSSDYLPTVYLNKVDTVVTGSATDYTLTNTAVKSTYVIDNSNPTVYSAYPTQINFITALGEVMKLGFTANKTGMYEISASISGDVNAGIKYSLIKESAQGAVTILEDEKNYTGEDDFALMNVKLYSGDTVYFIASADTEGTEISLGVSQSIYLGDLNKNSTILYKANEYAGITHFNDLGFSGAWEFGGFVNPFVVDGTQYNWLAYTTYDEAVKKSYDVLGIKNLEKDDQATDLISGLKPYDGIGAWEGTASMLYQLRENGYRYIANNTTKYIEQAPTRNEYFGQMKILKENSNTVTIRYGFDLAAGGGHANKVYFNFGHYQSFNVLSNGNVKLTLGDFSNPGKIVVLKNNTVIRAFTGGTITANDIIEINDALKGDKITIVYATIDDADNSLTINDSTASSGIEINPVVEFIPAESNESTVKFSGAVSTKLKENYSNGSIISLPNSSKLGSYFVGWNDGEATYQFGDEYIVNKDVTFTPKYVYYGDLNGTGEKITEDDLNIMRNVILGTIDIDDIAYGKIAADIDVNGKLNIIDLLR